MFKNILIVVSVMVLYTQAVPAPQYPFWNFNPFPNNFPNNFWQPFPFPQIRIPPPVPIPDISKIFSEADRIKNVETGSSDDGNLNIISTDDGFTSMVLPGGGNIQTFSSGGGGGMVSSENSMVSMRVGFGGNDVNHKSLIVTKKLGPDGKFETMMYGNNNGEEYMKKSKSTAK